MISALFVRRNSHYKELGLDCWDQDRDAMNFTGAGPVIAHPPCARWGNFWYADGSTSPGLDGGLFEFALNTLRRCGGVLEHPATSHAWARFGLPRAVPHGWTASLFEPDLWSTEVNQFNYGHRGRKATKLLYKGSHPIELDWKQSSPGAHPVDFMATPERERTPPAFAKLLIELATRSAT